MAIDEKLFALLLRRPAVLCLLFLLAAASCAPLITPKFDNTLEGWIDRDSVEYRDYQHLVETFGDDQNVLAVFQRQDLTPEKTAQYLEKLDLIRELPGVSGIYDPLQQFLGVSELDGVDEALVHYMKDFMSSRPADFRSVLISKDIETLGLLVLFDRDQAERYPVTLKAIEQAFTDLDIPCHFDGTVY